MKVAVSREPGAERVVTPLELIPDARIRIYEDSALAFLFQYPQRVAADVGEFLD
jgi:hypothetical protein